MPAFWGFTLTMIIGGPIVDSVVLPIMGRLLDTTVATEAIRTMSVLPAILIVLYGALFFVRRRSEAAQEAA